MISNAPKKAFDAAAHYYNWLINDAEYVNSMVDGLYQKHLEKQKEIEGGK